MFIGDLAASETYINGAFLWKYNLPALRHEKSELVIGYKSSKINCKSIGKDIKSFHDVMMMKFEEKDRKREKRRRWSKRLKILMIFGVALTLTAAIILAFTKSLPIGFMVLGFACIPPYGLYEFYNDC